MYLGNELHEVYIGNEKVVMTKAQAIEALKEIMAVDEPKHIGEHIDKPSYNDVYTDDLVRQKVKVCNVMCSKTEEEVEEVVDVAITTSLNIAQDFYESNYIMIEI